MTNTNKTSHRKLLYYLTQKSRKSQKGHAACCTHMYLLTSQKFPFFRLLSVSSVINIYLRNQRDLHDLKPTHIFVSIGARRLRRSCRFSSHTEDFLLSHTESTEITERPCGMIILTQRRRERRGHTDILFRTRIYRIPRIDDERLLTPPLAALTPPLRWEGSWLPPGSAFFPSCRHDGLFGSPPL